MNTQTGPEGMGICSVTPLPGKRLRLELCTGSMLELNMENRLGTMRCYALRDEDVFRSVTTDGYTLRFRTKSGSFLEFSLREAVLMALNPPPNTYGGFNPFEETE